MTPPEDGTFQKDSFDEPKGTAETMINISPIVPAARTAIVLMKNRMHLKQYPTHRTRQLGCSTPMLGEEKFKIQ